MAVKTLKRAQTIARARDLRRTETRAEARVWALLRNHRLGGWKWKRQAPVGPYFVDFLCTDAGLVLEVDGDVHVLQADYDARRTAFLQRSGFRVLRISNIQVEADPSGVCQTILRACGGARAAGPG